ncbi:EcsC family protein [Priestia megaterium]|nr:EcsC family protein [Priestia megaterium]
METRENLLLELKKIEKWEKNQKGLFFWEKLARIPFAALDKVTPKFIHEKIEKLLDEIAKYVDNGGQYLANTSATLEKASIRLEEEKQVSLTSIQQLSIKEMDELATYFVEGRQKNAKIQGATTGIGGIFTLAIDVPFVLGLTLKTLQEVAVAYGYDPTSQEERIFMVKCMQFSSADIVGKRAILEELAEENRGQSLSQLQGWREVFFTYRDNLGWKKLFQIIPIAGMIFGAYINKQAIGDIGEIGMMLYKKRRILERISQLPNE